MPGCPNCGSYTVYKNRLNAIHALHRNMVVCRTCNTCYEASTGKDITAEVAPTAVGLSIAALVLLGIAVSLLGVQAYTWYNRAAYELLTITLVQSGFLALLAIAVLYDLWRWIQVHGK